MSLTDLPGSVLYPNGIGSVELLSGRGIAWSEVDELLEGEDDGSERALAKKVRRALEVTRR